ncbi:hypothetical protein CCAX7_15890 [Capsulimonas corticalis]|uniref:Uncharacterized protein n=1 Tax=Capsulimonas corticalis TaxID=2219043 RepID=A0A402CZ52_9BACT|nr:lytic transglycosylase domain-containing protein [Capsulimonas corticalis]BDI29538.1 hypothetical protein CCAX7_15890 [Capsulimonas corticalis]
MPIDHRSLRVRRIALGLALTSAAALIGFTFTGCRPRPAPISGGATLSSTPPNPGADALPLHLDREQRIRSIIDGLRKPVMGRLVSTRDVSRVADQLGPIVAEAARAPEAQAILERMAREEGVSRETAQTSWVHLQEADLLLESGGDPDAISSAGAVGVAQWMPGVGGHGLLAVDLPASRRLTAPIDAFKQRIAWREYWRAEPPGAAPAPPPVSIGPALTPAQAAAELPALATRLELLRAQRRRIDRRYDPRQAIFAQTNYLLKLYPRFPSADWIFQAYHGGEAGVERTLRKYLGPQWPGDAAAAIRRGNAGRRLSFEDVYLTSSPQSHPAAFSYLYGRGDDHRHYWWKLRAAQEAIALYRRDPAAFQRQWEALLPGRGTDALWYGASPTISNTAALLAAARSGALIPIAGIPGVTVTAPSPRPFAPPVAVMRIEARGALVLIASAYRSAGGPGPLVVGDTTLSVQDADWLAAHAPISPRTAMLPPEPDIRPGGGPPANFNAHTTGTAFDLIPPTDVNARKTLEYALGYWKDRKVLWWKEEQSEGALRYHIAPNPAYRQALERIGAADSFIPAG